MKYTLHLCWPLRYSHKFQLITIFNSFIFLFSLSQCNVAVLSIDLVNVEVSVLHFWNILMVVWLFYCCSLLLLLLYYCCCCCIVVAVVVLLVIQIFIVFVFDVNFAVDAVIVNVVFVVVFTFVCRKCQDSLDWWLPGTSPPVVPITLCQLVACICQKS